MGCAAPGPPPPVPAPSCAPPRWRGCKLASITSIGVSAGRLRPLRKSGEDTLYCGSTCTGRATSRRWRGTVWSRPHRRRRRGAVAGTESGRTPRSSCGSTGSARTSCGIRRATTRKPTAGPGGCQRDPGAWVTFVDRWIGRLLAALGAPPLTPARCVRAQRAARLAGGGGGGLVPGGRRSRRRNAHVRADAGNRGLHRGGWADRRYLQCGGAASGGRIARRSPDQQLPHLHRAVRVPAVG